MSSALHPATAVDMSSVIIPDDPSPSSSPPTHHHYLHPISEDSSSTESSPSSTSTVDYDHPKNHNNNNINNNNNLNSSVHHIEMGSDDDYDCDVVRPSGGAGEATSGSGARLLEPRPHEVELIFHGLSMHLGMRSILDDISGHASPGQILAVMGPSGSGKTSLLNAISGRGRPDSGVVTLNGKPMCKQLRRQICYVLQDDVFFPSLTLRQTLMYTARLRLPDSMPYSEKVACVDKLIEDLQLAECQNTIIGNHSMRGLSGGEKKRANIACELLTNPSVMLIDEPTSGLDSCTAHSLVQIIKEYAVNKRKTIIMTVHQPSSQMFYMFDQLLLLSSGRLSYFGPIQNVVPFFNDIGYPISLHYNPADFILEKIKQRDCLEKITAAAKNLPKLPKFLEHHHHHHHHLQHAQQTDDVIKTQGGVEAWKKESLKSIELEINEVITHVGGGGGEQTAGTTPPSNHHHLHHNHHHHHHHNPSSQSQSSSPNHHHHHHDTDSGRSSWSEPDRSSTFSSNSNLHSHSSSPHHSPHHHSHHHHHHQQITKKLNKKNTSKWPTSRWTQVVVLTDRNFREAMPRMLSKMNWIQTVLLALIAGMIWFQPERREERIDDIRGWMFFTTNYWMLFGLFQAMTAFPAEREVINKERASGAYRLSSYYIAKMIGELPLTLALPSVYFLISYPMMGAASVGAFFACWFFLIASTICAQSVGLFIGAACCDFDVAVTFAALYSLATTLFAGFYTAIAPWLAWSRFFSMIYYAFLNMQLAEFGSSPILCAQQNSRFEYCERNRLLLTSANQTAISGPEVPGLYVPFADLKTTFDPMTTAPLSAWANTAILIGYLLFYRVLGYAVLRYGRPIR